MWWLAVVEELPWAVLGLWPVVGFGTVWLGCLAQSCRGLLSEAVSTGNIPRRSTATMLGMSVAGRSLQCAARQTALACRCRRGPAALALAPARRAASPHRLLSTLSQDNFSVWVQWDDWLGTGLAMDDVAEQEEFLAEKKIIPQQYFLHAGSPEFSPFQPLHERLYRVEHGFEQEDSTMMTVHEGDVVELLEQSDTGWWRMQVSAGEHHYEGWVPENVIDHHTQPDEEESDIFAMGRIWHGDSDGARTFQEDTQVVLRPPTHPHPARAQSYHCARTLQCYWAAGTRKGYVRLVQWC